MSIIGLLASIVMVNLQSARQKARDTAFLQEVVQFRTALESYRSDSGHYPNNDSQTMIYSPESIIYTLKLGKYVPDNFALTGPASVYYVHMVAFGKEAAAIYFSKLSIPTTNECTSIETYGFLGSSPCFHTNPLSSGTIACKLIGDAYAPNDCPNDD